jgi:hypothetical protein
MTTMMTWVFTMMSSHDGSTPEHEPRMLEDEAFIHLVDAHFGVHERDRCGDNTVGDGLGEQHAHV